MKKLIGLMIALTLVISLCACGGQPAAEQKTESGVASGEVTQADIAKNIVGTWIKSEVDGQPAVTDEKNGFDIVSTKEAYISESRIRDGVTPFRYNHKNEVDINGNVVTIITTNTDGVLLVRELTITSIHDSEFTANRKFTRVSEGGDSWAVSEDEMNEYFVAGNLLCARWIENGKESREQWEITIDGDKMNWTALRENEDGKTFTATFKMTKVKE